MNAGEMILYTTEEGKTSIQLFSIEGAVWMSKAEIASLFQTSPQNITLYIKAIYDEGELEEGATCKDFLQVALALLEELQVGSERIANK